MKKLLMFFFVFFVIAAILTGCSGNKFKVSSVNGVYDINVHGYNPEAVSNDGKTVAMHKTDSYQGMDLISVEPVANADGKMTMRPIGDGKIQFPNGVEVTVEYEGKQYVGIIKPGVSIKAETVGDKTVFLFDSKVFKPK